MLASRQAKSCSSQVPPRSRRPRQVAATRKSSPLRRTPFPRMEKTLEVWDPREVSANDAQVHPVYLE